MKAFSILQISTMSALFLVYSIYENLQYRCKPKKGRIEQIIGNSGFILTYFIGAIFSLFRGPGSAPAVFPGAP